MLLGLRPEWDVPDKHMCPASPMSADRTLHLYYSLLNLQKEIEKRTYYLGSKRAGVNEQAPHLLDLIGMSRDEKDLLYSFAKAAMADVYDALSQSTSGLPKLYKWEDKPEVQVIKRRLNYHSESSTASIGSNLSTTVGTDKILIGGSIAYGFNASLGELVSTDITNDVARPFIRFILSYDTSRVDIVTGQTITKTYQIPVEIGTDGIAAGTHVQGTPAYYWQVNHVVPIKLKGQDGKYTKEVLDNSSVAISSFAADDYWEYVKPAKVLAGTRFTISNNTNSSIEYQANVEFTENDLPERLEEVATIVDAGEAIEEGIHYYIGFPNYFEESLIEPLDNAILEALVNRIIWKWLCVSFPSEAQSYDTFYQQSIAALKTRTDIFKKHWVERTPRM